MPYAKIDADHPDENYQSFATNVSEYEANKLLDGSYYHKLIENTELLKSIKLESDYVLFNVGGLQIIEAMYFTGVPVYNHYPKEQQIRELLRKGRRIAVIKDKIELPEYFSKYPQIKFIEGYIHIVD